MKELMKKLAMLVLMLCIVSLVGCSSKEEATKKVVATKKVEKRTPTELMTEIETVLKNDDYEAFKKLFILSKGENYTREDFESLKKFMESKGKLDTYYAYSYSDKRVAVFKMDNIGEKSYISDFTKLPSSLYYHIIGIVEPVVLKSPNSSKGSITNLILSTEYIDKIAWSPDESYVAFRRIDMMNECSQIYLWKVGEDKPVVIKDGDVPLGKFIWSPDSKYVICDTGTYVVRGAYLISAKDFKLIKQFSYVDPICWSPDSKMFATSYVSKVTPKYSVEEVFDLAVFEAQTGNYTIVQYAEEDFYLNAQKWNKDGTITYQKTYLNSNKKEVLKYKYK